MGGVFFMVGCFLIAVAAIVGGAIFVRYKQAQSPAWAGFESVGTFTGYFLDGWKVITKQSWLILLPLGLYIANYLIAQLLYYFTLHWMGYDWDIFIRNISTPPVIHGFRLIQTLVEAPGGLNSGFYTVIMNNLFMALGTLVMVCIFWTVKRMFRNVIVASNMHNVSYFQTVLKVTFFCILVIGVLQLFLPVWSIGALLPKGLARVGVFAGLTGLVGLVAHIAIGSVLQGVMIVSLILGIRGEKLRRRRILNQALLKVKPLVTLNLILFVITWVLQGVNQLLIGFAHFDATALVQLLRSVITLLTMCIPFAIIMTERNVRGALRKTFRVLAANKWRYIQLAGIGSIVLALPKMFRIVVGAALRGYAFIGTSVVLEMIGVLLSVIFMTALLKFFLAYYDVDGWEVVFAAFERDAASAEGECKDDGVDVACGANDATSAADDAGDLMTAKG